MFEDKRPAKANASRKGYERAMPMTTLYLVVPLILIAIVLAAVWLDRFSVPVILIALATGILFGSDVLNWWDFSDIQLTKNTAKLALVFILFHGGFATRKNDLRLVALPAGGLATWGVVITAVATFLILYLGLDWPFEVALLLGVIISSTDAAAIFSILRRHALPAKLSSTVEIESAANDPMAVLLTGLAVDALVSGGTHPGLLGLMLLWKFSAAPLLGWGMARAAVWLFNRLTPQDRGHYYVLSIGLILLTYGAAESVRASGILAVFVMGFCMGNRRFVHKQGVANFSAALSTIANIGMFALLGLLVSPRGWIDIWQQGLILFVVISLIARPLAVGVGTLGMRLPGRHKVFIAWAGLRGAVPIVLATYPVAAGMETGHTIFNLVFFVVILSVLLQGLTLGPLAHALHLIAPRKPAPLFHLELITMAPSNLDLVFVDLPDHAADGNTESPAPLIRDLPLPEGAVITLITHHTKLTVPRGSTRLRGGDRVTVLCQAADVDEVRAALLAPFEPSDS
jgi:potassium/hydrogen antiporter